MQTLKTAIVVLLMMTVIYASYVSLTTPPQPLPDEVASLIEESADFEMSIDEGIADSFVDLGPETPTGGTDTADLLQAPSEQTLQPGSLNAPSANVASSDSSPANGSSQTASEDLAADLGADDAMLNGPSTTLGSPSPESTPVTESLTDLNSSPSSTPIRTNSFAVTPASTKSGFQLPKPDPNSSVPAVDPNQSYPSTQTEALDLPNPNSFTSGPDGKWSTDATAGGFDLPPTDNAVTANLSDSAANGDTANSSGFSMPGTEGAATPPSLNAANVPASSAEPNQGLANAIRTADRQYAAGQMLEALMTLSLFYNSPDLTSSDREALVSRLDPLAAAVIYSRRHLLEQPHRVGANETLMEVATKYEVPWQLLANINGIEDPVAILPGTELKVVRGPFRAEVDVARNELTIFLRDLYAGRFQINVGAQPAPEPGTYTVLEKQSARTFYDSNGSPVPPGDARNPYGTVWMDLGKQLCIHGSPDRSKPTTEGCISLRGDQAEDLYGILSQGSSVTIRR